MPDPNNPTDPSQNPPAPTDMGTGMSPSMPEPTVTAEIPPLPSSDVPTPPDAGAPIPPDTQPVEGMAPQDTNAGSAAPSFDIPPVVTPGQPKKKFGGKRVVATILGLLVLVGGLGAGIVLVRQQQDIREKAAIAEPCKACVGTQCKTIASPPDCSASLNECSSNSQCAPVPKGCTSDSQCSSGQVCQNGSCVTKPKAECSSDSQCSSGQVCQNGNCVTPKTNCSSLTAVPWQSCPSECAGTVDELATCTLGAKKWKCTGKQWQPNYGDVGDCKTSCPWPTTNGKCCPVKPDACSKPGEIICIEDPFASKCTVWDMSCPAGQQYYYLAIDWDADFSEIEARNKCGETPSSPRPTPGIVGSCLNVKAYDTNWNLLTTDQLKALKSGDKVRFTVSGTTSSGSFDKAKFKINGAQRPEVTQKKPSSEEYYDEYTVPEGTAAFTIKAQIHHTTLGWSPE